MPRPRAELVELVTIPSVSETGFPTASRPALLRARDAVAALSGCRAGAGGAGAAPGSQLSFGVRLQVHPGATGNGFAARTSSAAYEAAREAWSAAWGADTVTIGAGGSIPLVSALQQAVPEAEILLVGTADGFAASAGRTSVC